MGAVGTQGSPNRFGPLVAAKRFFIFLSVR